VASSSTPAYDCPADAALPDARYRHPIVQAPVGSVFCPALAAAVADAGGLGTLAVSWREADETRAVIEETTARTSGSVAVNVVLDERGAAIDPDRVLDVVLDSDVGAVSLSFGDPDGYVERCLDAGKTTPVTVGTDEQARAAVEAGADVVVAQGWGAGGHLQSDVATMALVLAVVDAVPDTPVVAAGGIGDGRGLAAALALGADGGWLGTRFVATAEANAHPRYKAAIAGASVTETRRSQLFDGGWPGRDHRTLRTDAVREWEQAGEPATGARPGEGETVAKTPDGDTIERYADVPPLPGMDGAVEKLPQYAGQSAGLTDKIESASAVVTDLVSEATAALEAAERRRL
jgi:nitronate monooxygenase